MTLLLERAPRPVPDVHDDATRREFIVGGVAASLLVVAGCGTDEEQSDDAAPPTTERNGAFPVAIGHKFGRTEISAEPQRVVSVGFTDQDAILSLGVVPVGIRDFYGDQPNAVWPWGQQRVGDATPEVLSAEELNFEQIAALRPDLIIGVSSGMTDDDYATLSEIAPTLAQPAAFADLGVPWQEQTLLAGRALGRVEQAEQLVGDLEARFETIRKEHPEFEAATIFTGITGDGEYYPYGPQDPRARFFTSLGFEVPAEIDDLAGDDSFATISDEQFDLVQADLIVWIVNTPDHLARLESLPIYQQLPAVREGRDILLPIFADTAVLAGALGFSTVLSIPVALDGLVPPMVAALDGDPATEAAVAR